MRAEDGFQITMFDYLTRKGVLAFHIKNQGKWSVAYGAKLKRMGRRKGMADLGCITEITPHLPRGMFMLECKRPPEMLKSGKRSQAKPKLSSEQEEVAALFAARGIPTIVVNNLDEAIAEMRKLGVPLKGRTL